MTFWTSIAAFKDADGGVWGTAVVQVDLSTFGLGQIGLQNAVNCVDIVGNSAWVGGVVTHSTNPDIIPPGVVTITLVRDLGGEGQDIMHGELFGPGSVCTDRPALPESVVVSGNFKVW